ncbi:AraC family transcriptional regulator [Jannaschia pohangensis]|uniref:Transcriptional regulator, AraC family n=1 Tax=Jannaschia pohangensis TaxID=390807 RepID=A0A1I3TTP5_9RHOB|nr:AraC family transcriptional regulator [Jannaschia pohangensis]SFJ74628.1 transcriptional regulator, AraC family [Jannaschia pohangensis]
MTDATCKPGSSGTYDNLYGTLYRKFPQENRSAGSERLALVVADQDSHATPDPPVDDVVFRLVTRGGTRVSQVDYGDGLRTLAGRVGSLYLAPAGATAHWEAEGTHQIMLLALPRTILATMLSGLGDGDPLASLYGREIFDPQLAGTMNRIWTESESEGPVANLMVDGLLMSMTAMLARMSDTETEMTGPDTALDAKRLNRVTEFVEANLSENISVDMMAQVACLSPAHFARTFRAATGMPPHAYVLSRRLDAARRMLGSSDLALSEIALACDFSSQSHFTARFRDVVGQTPHQFRAATR